MAVAKASQAISMELSWGRVVRRLLEVALEQGGADRTRWLLASGIAAVLQAGASPALACKCAVTSRAVRSPRRRSPSRDGP